MSNQIVGSTYQEIISRVITESQSAFEEAGLPAEVLKELREEWQRRLSDLKVAQFPWDPPPSTENPPTVPSNARPVDVKQERAAQPQPVYDNTNRAQPGAAVKQEQNFKPEGGYDAQPPPLAGAPANGYNGPLTGQQRAQALLQREYGQHANASIAAMSQSQRQNGQPPQQHPQHPQHPQQQPRPGQGQPGTQQQHPSLGSGQTDGPGDMTDPADGRRLDADATIRDQIEALREQLDNGLLLPYTNSRHAKLKARSKVSASAMGPLHEAGPSNVDGGDDDEVDEDAINSDLDDPDDDPQRQEDQEEEIKEVILCTYDKVQRVKNKWKCTLKDGILTTNQKEYLFHKATGEFEW